MKNLSLILAFIWIVALTGCKNPQEKDVKAAEEKEEQAAEATERSNEQQSASDANAASAAVAQYQSNIDKAMAAVPMPKFKKSNAKDIAEDYHKYLSEMVNANSGKKAAEYREDLVELKDKYLKKVADGKFDSEDKAKLDKYIADMENAVESANP